MANGQVTFGAKPPCEPTYWTQYDRLLVHRYDCNQPFASQPLNLGTISITFEDGVRNGRNHHAAGPRKTHELLDRRVGADVPCRKRAAAGDYVVRRVVWRNVEAVLGKDEMLDTIMLYWLSNSGTSSARYYWENQLDNTAWPIDLPVGVSWFGGDNSYAPREWCERYYKNIVYWSETARGGHVAAWEVPDMFVSEVRGWKRRIK
ncbi:hypothetical protein MY10362_007703 [Beauveria mimosiformis]